MKYKLLILLATSTSPAHAWTISESVDAISDKSVSTVKETAADGTTFTLVRKTDNSVWAYIKLTGANQFMVNERLVVRIDKNEPSEFNDDLQKLTEKLGKPLPSWEWNPSLIGFRIWHGSPNQGCGQVEKLMIGSTMIVRYHPNQSTTRDLTFDISKDQLLIPRSLKFDPANCLKK